jgi:hypothetical protein
LISSQAESATHCIQDGLTKAGFNTALAPSGDGSL